MAKKNSSSTPIVTQKKTKNVITALPSRSWIDFLDNNAYSLYPARDEWRKRLIYTMLTWAEQPDSLEINEFSLQMRIHPKTMFDWCNKYPDLKEAYDMAKRMIGVKRSKGALKKEYEREVVMKTMHFYDPDWKEIDKYNAELKRNEAPAERIVPVILGDPGFITKEQMASGIMSKKEEDLAEGE